MLDEIPHRRSILLSALGGCPRDGSQGTEATRSDPQSLRCPGNSRHFQRLAFSSKLRNSGRTVVAASDRVVLGRERRSDRRNSFGVGLTNSPIPNVSSQKLANVGLEATSSSRKSFDLRCLGTPKMRAVGCQATTEWCPPQFEIDSRRGVSSNGPRVDEPQRVNVGYPPQRVIKVGRLTVAAFSTPPSTSPHRPQAMMPHV
jgi:hypothetical protein